MLSRPVSSPLRSILSTGTAGSIWASFKDRWARTRKHSPVSNASTRSTPPTTTRRRYGSDWWSWAATRFLNRRSVRYTDSPQAKSASRRSPVDVSLPELSVAARYGGRAGPGARGPGRVSDEQETDRLQPCLRALGRNGRADPAGFLGSAAGSRDHPLQRVPEASPRGQDCERRRGTGPALGRVQGTDRREEPVRRSPGGRRHREGARPARG